MGAAGGNAFSCKCVGRQCRWDIGPADKEQRIIRCKLKMIVERALWKKTALFCSINSSVSAK